MYAPSQVAPNIVPPPENASCTTVSDYSHRAGWESIHDAALRAARYCRELERGKILFFARTPFPLPRFDCDYLTQQPQSSSRLHKNISYRPVEDVLRGFTGASSAQPRMRRIMRDYSEHVAAFVERFLSPYSGKAVRDYASFRQVEEQGRDLPMRKRNDLLHIDAFPNRPTHGGRILRVFTNIHPVRDRVWLTGGPFASLAQRYAVAAGLHEIRESPMKSRLAPWLRSVSLPFRDRSLYDKFMLRFHDFLKERPEYQAGNHTCRVEFAPMSTWMVFTDGVAHAVLSGQFALEQTFMVPVEALVSPDQSPIRVLEKIAGRPLA